MIFMVVGNACDFSWRLATHMIHNMVFMVVGNACDFSWWLETHMIFHGGRQRM